MFISHTAQLLRRRLNKVGNFAMNERIPSDGSLVIWGQAKDWAWSTDCVVSPWDRLKSRLQLAVFEFLRFLPSGLE